MCEKHQNTNVVIAAQAVSKQDRMDVQMALEALVKHCIVYGQNLHEATVLLIRVWLKKTKKTLVALIISQIAILGYFCCLALGNK